MGISTVGKTENLSEMTLKERFAANIKLRENAYQNGCGACFFFFIEVYLFLV